MRTPKQTDPQFKLRLTPEIDEAIEAAATESGRTKNSEILFRLEASFDRERRMREQVAATASQKERDAAAEREYQTSTDPLVVARREAYETAANAVMAEVFVEMILKGQPVDFDRIRETNPGAVAMAEAELARLGKR